MAKNMRHITTGRGLFSILFVVFCFICTTQTAKTGPSHGKIVVCYISTWAVYRPGHGAYSIENFDANLCTHAIYAFAGLDITQSAIKSLDPWQDLKEEYGKGGYERLTNLKRTHPHLKVNLAIGGWNEGSKNYSNLVSDPFLRGRFVKQVASFVRKYNFDGLDLDWEYPTQRGGLPKDRENFVLLTKELREEFDNYDLLLTSAIGASKLVIDQAYDMRQISRYLDFLHVMCYDYHGSWDKIVGYNAPLMAADGDFLSVQYTIDYILKLGAPAEKIVMGLPFYGRTFITRLAGNIGDATDDTSGTHGFQGPFTREDGFLGYNEICNILSNKTAGWTTMWDARTSQMLMRSKSDAFSGIVKVVTFDNARAIANKVRFAMMKNLAGVMIWSVDTDDFRGECELEEDAFADFKNVVSQEIVQKRSIKNYQLLRTVNEAANLALDEQDQQDKDNEQNVDSNEIPHGDIEDRKSGNSVSGANNFSIPLCMLTLSNALFLLVILCQGSHLM